MRDASLLLQAVSELLMNDVRPALADPRLAFRALIAGNLARLVAAGLIVDEKLEAEAIARLRTLVDIPGDREALEAELAKRLRAGSIAPEAARAALMANLAAQLAVDNPLFDLVVGTNS